MARARNLKPGFFENETLAETGPVGQVLFAGLWGLADREGRLEDRPARIKAKVFPYYEADVEHVLNELSNRGFVCRYHVGETRYIQIVNFDKHQNPHRNEAPSSIPARDKHQTSTVPVSDKHRTTPADSLFSDSLTPDSLFSDSGGSGGDSEPSPDEQAADAAQTESEPDEPQEPTEETTDSLPGTDDASPPVPVAPSPPQPVPKAVPKPEKDPPGFAAFALAYPNKSDRKVAADQWRKLKPDKALQESILAAIEAQKRSRKWQEGFVKAPHRWLRDRNWEDEIETEAMPIRGLDPEKYKGGKHLAVRGMT